MHAAPDRRPPDPRTPSTSLDPGAGRAPSSDAAPDRWTPDPRTPSRWRDPGAGPAPRPPRARGRALANRLRGPRLRVRRERVDLGSHRFERARPRRPFGAPPCRPREETKPEPAHAGRPGKNRPSAPRVRPTRPARGRSATRRTPSGTLAGRSRFVRDVPGRRSVRYPFAPFAAPNGRGRTNFVDDATRNGSARSPDPCAEVDPASFGALGAGIGLLDLERGRARNLRAGTGGRSDRAPFGSDAARSDDARADPSEPRRPTAAHDPPSPEPAPAPDRDDPRTRRPRSRAGDHGPPSPRSPRRTAPPVPPSSSTRTCPVSPDPDAASTTRRPAPSPARPPRPRQGRVSADSPADALCRTGDPVA